MSHTDSNPTTAPESPAELLAELRTRLRNALASLEADGNGHAAAAEDLHVAELPAEPKPTDPRLVAALDRLLTAMAEVDELQASYAHGNEVYRDSDRLHWEITVADPAENEYRAAEAHVYRTMKALGVPAVRYRGHLIVSQAAVWGYEGCDPQSLTICPDAGRMVEG